MDEIYKWTGLALYGMGVYDIATKEGDFFVFIPGMFFVVIGLLGAFLAGYAIYDIERNP